MTTTEPRNIKIMPGWMILIRTKVEGGVEYERNELDHHREGAADVASWETRRRIEDKEEHERACGVRNEARKLITRQCIRTPFREICEADNIGNLDAAIVEARGLIATHNATARHSTVKLYVLKGEIAKDETEAVEAITGEIKDLLGDLDESIRKGQVAEIREIASRARTMGKMLDQQEKAKGQLDRAVKAARRVASSIAKKVDGGAEELASVLAEANLKPINLARFTFGDEDVEQPDESADDGVGLPAIATQRFLDLGSDGPEEPGEQPAEAESGDRFSDLAPDEED